MVKREMVVELAKQMDCTYTEANAVFNQVVDVIRDSIVNNLRVKVNGLGMFRKRLQENRVGRNPQTGEDANIPSYIALTFRASKSLKESI